MRWVGTATTVHAVGQAVVKHRVGRDRSGGNAMSIPDHVDILCRMEQGGQMRMSISTVFGLASGTEVRLYGTEGTIRLAEEGGKFALSSGRRGDSALQLVDINPEKVGSWLRRRGVHQLRSAARRRSPIPDLATAVKYMEWSDAVCTSVRTGQTVHLPLAQS